MRKSRRVSPVRDQRPGGSGKYGRPQVDGLFGRQATAQAGGGSNRLTVDVAADCDKGML